ncbi:hypothetical protein CC80DRAFT_495203 [Byssothecium circinans]|uniref:DUF3431 domain-containing protein n=1 Tax=Byssothecium circinans TaxID=147558 RepID=A0A6A5TIY9_9PLEO|nr:hypothetical protein CC80DRAFT_495203 [Byssothecium circinans]
MSWFSPRRAIPLAAILLLIPLLFWSSRFGTPTQQLQNLSALYHDAVLRAGRPPFFPGVAKSSGAPYSRILVVAKTLDENVRWIDEELPDLKKAIYEVDKPGANYSVPKNKGNEAMVYLTYIVDHYSELPDIVIFVHAHSAAWHNNILLDLHMPTTIQRLSDDRVTRQGYMNLRCHLAPGCPDWIHLERAEMDFDMQRKPEEKHFSTKLFLELFPGHRPPPALSQPCCAQFALSRERIRDNPKKLYVHIRDWLLKTDLNDADSGRVLEYMWQYLFTRNAEHCPSTNSCYCDGYGVCFGNATMLDDWLEKYKMKESVDDEMGIAKRKGDGPDVIAEIEGRRSALETELNEGREEAYKRGESERNRAAARERVTNYGYS